MDRTAPARERRRRTVGHVRLGYARASTTRQSLDAQLDSLAEAGVTRVFAERISTRATKRSELEAAVKLAGEIRSFGIAVTLVVHEHKRFGRGIELAMRAEELKEGDHAQRSDTSCRAACAGYCHPRGRRRRRLLLAGRDNDRREGPRHGQ